MNKYFFVFIILSNIGNAFCAEEQMQIDQTQEEKEDINQSQNFKKIICKYCKVSFQYEGNYKTHLAIKHKGKNPSLSYLGKNQGQCKHCGFICHVNNLWRHRKIHKPIDTKNKRLCC